MTTMSLGIRNSGSNGSLQQFHLLAIQTTPPLSARKAFSKMSKEKESLFHWICKFAGRKKVGMLLLCLVSAAVFGWVLYVGKGLIPHSSIPFTLVAHYLTLAQDSYIDILCTYILKEVTCLIIWENI